MFRKHRALLAGLALLSAASGANAALVISQAYGGGGNSGATYTNDFIEIFNNGFTAVSLNGMSVQYSGATASTWAATNLGNVLLQPGQYYLIQEAAGTGGTTALPTPDATGTISMSGTQFKIALVSNTTTLSGACPTVGVVDMLGVGPTANCSETAPTAAASNTTAAIRKTGGCTDTVSNVADFNLAAPTPRNTGSTFNPCGGGGPALAIADVVQAEGNSGTSTFAFTVSLTVPAGAGGVTFDIATQDSSATLAGNDYVANSVVGASIPMGQSSYTFNVTVNGDTVVEAPESFLVNVSNVTGANVGDPQAEGKIVNDEVVEIHDIQGSGLASLYAGTPIVTNNNVVTGKGPQGFTMQAPDVRADANINTSEGIYVFTASAPTVVIGDMVNVSGNALEFNELTEIGSATVSFVSSGNPLPTPVEFNTSVPSSNPNSPTCVTSGSDLECFEGMLVHIADGITTTGNQRFGSPATETFAEVFITANGRRGVREPGLLFPLTTTAGNSTAGEWDGNPEMFEMDADYFGAVPVDTPITGGTRFNATGVIGFDFGDYELWATALAITDAVAIPRPVRDSSGPTDLRIGAFNMLRFCDSVNSGAGEDPCVDPTPTGGAGGTLEVKVARLSAYINQVLKAPDVVGSVEVENITVLNQLAAKLSLDSGAPYVARLEEGNDVGGIDVGFLVRTDRVTITATTQLGKLVTWNDPTGSPTALLNDRPPLLLEATFTGGGGPGMPFAVMVVHPKARSCTDKPTGATCTQADVDRNRLKRLTQGEYHAQQIQNYQSTHAGVPLAVVGDFNAYQFTDGWADVVGAMQGTYDNAANLLDYPVGGALVTPHLWNAVTSLPLNDQYSFLFTENFGAFQGFNTRDVPTQQVLDHALLNGPARALFSGFDYGRADQDAPNEWERQCNLVPIPAPPACPNPAIGVSDHDGLVVKLATDRIFADGFEAAP